MTTLMTEPTTKNEPAGTAGPAGEQRAVPRDLCERCRCPRPVPGPTASGSSRTAARDFVPQEELASLLPGLERNPELDLATLAYHARQSDATARDSYRHAAINEARAFLEALVISIGLEQERPPEETIADFRKRRASHYGFHSCNNYLVAIGLFNPHERITVEHVYTIASDSGSHAGVSSEAWCRFARRIVWTTARYVIQRYDAWKSGCRCHAAW